MNKLVYVLAVLAALVGATPTLAGPPFVIDRNVLIDSGMYPGPRIHQRYPGYQFGGALYPPRRGQYATAGGSFTSESSVRHFSATRTCCIRNGVRYCGPWR
jgi:hypothetical protein